MVVTQPRGGSGRAEEDAQIKACLYFSSAEEVTICQFLGQRRSLHLEDTVFVNVLCVLLASPSEQMFLGLKNMEFNYGQRNLLLCWVSGSPVTPGV